MVFLREDPSTTCQIHVPCFLLACIGQVGACDLPFTSHFLFLQDCFMSWLREPNAEPIPGYRLIEPLGNGGFGEVWKCEAPGGLVKAIKFVYGNLISLDV